LGDTFIFFNRLEHGVPLASTKSETGEAGMKKFPPFIRKGCVNGRWDVMCGKCFQILAADSEEELPVMEAAHECAGFKIAESLRPGQKV
jgi:hypothetical protein